MIVNKFAERLNDLIFDNKLTVKTFIEKSNLSKTAVYEYLSAKKLPSTENAVMIADYFNCSLDYLFGLENEFYFFRPQPFIPFCEILPKVLNKYGVSRYKLHKMTKISQSTLYYWAKGKSSPTIDSLVVIATALNCSIDFLTGRERD